MDVTVALTTRLQAKPAKGQEVADLLASGLGVLEDEPGTATWFAVRYGVLEFGLFAAYPDEVGREEHLARMLAAALQDNAHLFEEQPDFETADVLAGRLPASASTEDGIPPNTPRPSGVRS